MQRFVNGVFDGNRAIIFFEEVDNKFQIIKVKLGEIYFQAHEFSAIEKEKLLKEIDKNNCDVI